MKLKLLTASLCVAMFMGLVPAHGTTTAAGDVFAFGFNYLGRTGLGTTNGSTTVATPIDTSNLDGRAITQVATGGEYSLLLAEDGDVFAFGFNPDGRAGLGTTSGSTTVATPIDASNLGGRVITQVAARNFHSLLLSEDGTVFSFGENDNGRTGQGMTSGNTTVATPIDTSNLGGRAITQVATGGKHSLLLSEDGSVFSFGNNAAGQTGLGTANGNTLVATPIDASNLGGRAITQVAAGRYHNLLLAEDGTVFSFGSNYGGQTGLGTALGGTTVATPIDVSNLGGRAITQVAAGGYSSLLLAGDGTVFSIGNNGFGKTGLGMSNGSTLVATAIDISNLVGLAGVQVSAGDFHNLLIAVPEPGTLALAGPVLLCLAVHRSRHRK